MHVFAYLDPATGSLFIQVLIGGVLAGSVVLRGMIRNGVDKFKIVVLRQKASN